MVSENVVILVFLCVLCVRGRLVRRGWALVVAILVWGMARLLMEMSFKGGSYEYAWGSLPALVAVGCLSLSVLLIYAACAGQGAPARATSAGQHKPADGDEAAAPLDSSERIRRILES